MRRVPRRFGDIARDGLAIREITWRRMRLATVAGNVAARGLQRPRAASADGDVSTVRRKAQRDRPPDASAASSDDDPFTLEVERHVQVLRSRQGARRLHHVSPCWPPARADAAAFPWPDLNGQWILPAGSGQQSRGHGAAEMSAAYPSSSLNVRTRMRCKQGRRATDEIPVEPERGGQQQQWCEQRRGAFEPGHRNTSAKAPYRLAVYMCFAI